MNINDERKDDLNDDAAAQDQKWLRELIEKDWERFELPESLKSKNLIHKLDGIEPAPTSKNSEDKRGSKVIWLKYFSAAACLALVAFGWNAFAQNNKAAGIAQTAMSSSAAAMAMDAPMSAMAAEARIAPEEAEASAMEDESFLEDIDIPEQPCAKSYNEIYSAILEMTKAQGKAKESPSYSTAMPGNGGAMAEDSVVAVNPATSNSTKAYNDADYGVYSTNTQVQGVDESDIVKTDGTYIYHYRFDSSTGGAQVAIITANGLQKLSAIELADYSQAEMYVSGDRLVIVENLTQDDAQLLQEKEEKTIDKLLTQHKETTEKVSEGQSDSVKPVENVIPSYINPQKKRDVSFTEAIVFDISDHKAPKEINRYRQDGYYVSSRMSGDMLYLVSNKHVYNDISLEMPAKYYLPMAGNGDNIGILPSENIFLPPYLQNYNYAVVTALNTESGKADTKAVLGMADEIMMSKNNLYLTATVYGENTWSRRNRSTGISRFAVVSDGLKYLASGKVDGYIDNQFSLDEYNGNLRIATTSYNDEGVTVNNLFVLDQKLQPVGSVENLAENERIYSVRYMGDTAYIVTFRETDPLFVIDLSNPAAPAVKGQLKIPGFSEYLHPIDENTLVGLGRNTSVSSYGETFTDGLKLSLFDVSDPTDPIEKACYLLGNTSSDSEALKNHKAFMYYPQKKLIGFPANIYTSYGATPEYPWSGESRLSFGGFLVVEVKDSGFDVVGTISNSGKESQDTFMRNDLGETIERGIYIGNAVYTVSQSKIMAFSLKDFQQIGELKY